jgi:hypothetical protein
MLRSVTKSNIFFAKSRLAMHAYQYIEEVCKLKCILKENEVDQVQDDPRLPEPEVLV